MFMAAGGRVFGLLLSAANKASKAASLAPTPVDENDAVTASACFDWSRASSPHGAGGGCESVCFQ